MNKYQEAFKDIIDYGVDEDYFDNESWKSDEKNRFLIVQELVDKETPIKTNPNGQTRNECGKCTYEVEDYFNYCRKCGQAVDWSKDE